MISHSADRIRQLDWGACHHLLQRVLEDVSTLPSLEDLVFQNELCDFGLDLTQNTISLTRFPSLRRLQLNNSRRLTASDTPATYLNICWPSTPFSTLQELEICNQYLSISAFRSIGSNCSSLVHLELQSVVLPMTDGLDAAYHPMTLPLLRTLRLCFRTYNNTLLHELSRFDMPMIEEIALVFLPPYDFLTSEEELDALGLLSFLQRHPSVRRFSSSAMSTNATLLLSFLGGSCLPSLMRLHLHVEEWPNLWFMQAQDEEHVTVLEESLKARWALMCSAAPDALISLSARPPEALLKRLTNAGIRLKVPPPRWHSEVKGGEIHLRTH
ncbi:hypothetical protein CALVIDRAFT_542778, partial [Calocera viscosa TUFC12733]